MDDERNRLAVELRSRLATCLPTWLSTRRWYADKSRTVTNIEIECLDRYPWDATQVAMMIVGLEFTDGSSSRYFLPLVIAPRSAIRKERSVIAVLEPDFILFEGSETVEFAALLPAILGGRIQLPRGWSETVAPDAVSPIAQLDASTARALGVEQSNTSLRYDDAAIVKIVRRLQPAPNPEEEMLSALAPGRLGSVPRFLASLAWNAADGTRYPVALVENYVPNVGDGWSWILDRLDAVAKGNVDPSSPSIEEPIHQLGRRTAELHLALRQIDDPMFRPEVTSLADITTRETNTRTAARVATDLIQQEFNRVRKDAGAANTLKSGIEDVLPRIDGYGEELGLNRIRVHGDLHLGQVLRTTGGDWVIIDFEGEPARTVTERREKQSVLKDVSGMLRSFAYARGAAELSARNSGLAGADAILSQWEQRARDAFLSGYRDELGASGAGLVPLDRESFEAALAAWELDKALYEVVYEARNRPDWLWLPLQAITPGIADQLSARTGGAPA
ncbi:MAG: phosphotransferase [Thermomicrobiales bacterium]